MLSFCFATDQTGAGCMLQNILLIDRTKELEYSNSLIILIKLNMFSSVIALGSLSEQVQERCATLCDLLVDCLGIVKSRKRGKWG